MTQFGRVVLVSSCVRKAPPHILQAVVYGYASYTAKAWLEVRKCTTCLSAMYIIMNLFDAFGTFSDKKMGWLELFVWVFGKDSDEATRPS